LVSFTPSKNLGQPRRMQSLDQFLETMSIESSLYTSPSKPTIQYHRQQGTPNIGWDSSQSSEEYGEDTKFTAELAFDQYKLGGWQSPSNIEEAVTPSTESTFSSLTPSKPHYTEDRKPDKAESHQVFRSGWVKHPLVSTCDYSPRVLVNERESNLEVQSITSSEISWNYDSQAYHEQISSAIASYDDNCVPGNTFIVDVRSNVGDDEESVCSSVSSIYTNRNYNDTPGSNISTWSPTCSPADHAILQDDVEPSNYSAYEPHVNKEATPQYFEFPGENDSTDRENDITLSSDYDEQVSFSELISRCEDESLAERLAPPSSSPRKRLFGRIIDTNCADSLPNSSTSDLSRLQTETTESSWKPTISAAKENNRKIDTPKTRNTSTSMISTDSIRKPDTEVQTEGQSSTSNLSSKNGTNFPSIRSKFEAQSLEHGMEPPTPRRLSRDDLPLMTNVIPKEESSHCSDGESYQSNHLVNEKIDESIFQEDVQSPQKGTIIRSPSPCREETPSTPLDCPEGSAKPQQNKSMYEMSPEKVFRLETESAYSVSSGYPDGSLVDLDEFSMDEVQQEVRLQKFDSFIPEKVHAPIEPGITNHDKVPYCGPVDLDESVSAWEDDDDEDSDVDVKRCLVENATPKRVQDSGGSNLVESYFLSRDELTRYEGSMERYNPVQNLVEPRFVDWKGEEDRESLHFQELHEKVMSLKNRQEESRLASPEPYCSAIDNVQANTMPENTNSTILKTPPRKMKMKIWKFFIRILQRNKNRRKGNGNCELSAESIDKFMLVSTDDSVFGAVDFADLSLFPLNQLENLTNNTFHDGLRDQMLERLTWERKRQWIAEVDRERDEWCEQMRTSIRKERELDRQRILNSRRSDCCVPHGVDSPHVGCSIEQTSFSPRQTNEQSGPKMDGIIYPHNVSEEGCLLYNTPRNYLCEKSRVTHSTNTTRPLDSLESFSVNSFLHTDLSFASPETTSSLNSPKMVSIIPPCIVCKVSERTHISLPCMHYSFCAECAEKLHEREIPTCPICHTENIALSRVYT